MSEFTGGVFDRIKQNHEDSTSDYFVNIALKNNGQVSDVAFRMLDLACQLEETLPEYNPHLSKVIVKLNQRQNMIFQQYRTLLRFVYLSTYIQVEVNSPTKEDTEVVKKINYYLNKPYGTYPIKEILRPGEEYFSMLVHKGIVPIVLGYKSESGLNKFMKG